MNRSVLGRHAAALALTAGLIAGSAQAADAPLELIQAGDSEKSCAALMSEINTLSEREAKAAKRAETGRKFLGLAGTALQVAAPMLGAGRLGGGQGGLIAQQALGSIQQQAAQQQMQQDRMAAMAQIYGARSGMPMAPAAAEAPAEKPASIAAQRVEHLRGLHAQKSC